MKSERSPAAELRSGYTTGACAAAAAKAAAMVLCGGVAPQEVEISLPDGMRIRLPVLYARLSGEEGEAAVRKTAGEDPDVTDKLPIIARVRFFNEGMGSGVQFEAGEGVGIVTKPGLSAPVGEPAINPVPRRMISAALAEVANRAMKVAVSIPGGREIAQKTFNPRLGVVGGLSILGTTGRVRPFSVPALVDSLKCSLSVAAACGVAAPVLVPGNIGERAARRNFRLAPEQVINVGNHWGSLLDEVMGGRFVHVLIMGHPGKLAKLIEGEWNTHSGVSSSAVPIVMRLGETVFGRPLEERPTVEGLFKTLSCAGSRALGDALSSRIRECVLQRLGGRPETAVALTNMDGDILGSSGDLHPWR